MLFRNYLPHFSFYIYLKNMYYSTVIKPMYLTAVYHIIFWIYLVVYKSNNEIDKVIIAAVMPSITSAHVRLS